MRRGSGNLRGGSDNVREIKIEIQPVLFYCGADVGVGVVMMI